MQPAQSAQGVGRRHPPHGPAVSGLDKSRQDTLGDTTGAPGLVQTRPPWLDVTARMTAPTGSDASQLRSTTRTPTTSVASLRASRKLIGTPLLT